MFGGKLTPMAAWVARWNVIRSIRNARVSLKTGLFILALALLLWAMVVYVRVRDFVPEEFKEPVEAPVRTP